MSSNAVDFAPYQDTSPENDRALSPGPRRSLSRSPVSNSGKPQIRSSIDAALPPPSHFSDDVRGGERGGFGSGGGRRDVESGRQNVNLFETSLPMRLDYEAMMAYILLPPAGGVFLLIFEHKSDYVRFHAWQSSLVFAALFVLHLVLMWSRVLSWMLFVLDVALIAFLSFHAYRDADSLDRFEVPFFGGLASRYLDSE
ncbi:hypothetical protein MMC25_003885 [Agyrium rufum]|nr:hypothetical protein [Agyrium rufum]